MSSLIVFEKLYLHIPYQEKEWAKQEGLKFDGKAKCWYLPAGKNPLPFRDHWAYLENTYEDRALLKRKGCRFNANLKQWYVPLDKDFDDFRSWWPSSLKQFLFCDERFAVHEHMTSSGQAEVYRAWDCDGDEGWVALKFFYRDLGFNSTAMVRKGVGVEIDALTKLEDHPNIAKMLGWEFKDEIERFCIASRWVPGGDIENLMNKTDEGVAASLTDKFIESGLILFEDREDVISSCLEAIKDDNSDDVESDLGLLDGILEGLAYAHKNGILHRDIKPSNVMIDVDLETEEIRPVICDFGTSKTIKLEDVGQVKRSKFTTVEMSSAPYRPEFTPGTDSGEKEIANQHTWDLYAWSMMTIEFITGQTVDNREEGLALLKQNLGPKVGGSIQELLESAIAANPEDRPSDIEGFKKKLYRARTERLTTLE